MPADLMAIAHVRRVLLELGFEDVPEHLVPASLGMSLWVSLPIAELFPALTAPARLFVFGGDIAPAVLDLPT